jgi:hypothetical protein
VADRRREEAVTLARLSGKGRIARNDEMTGLVEEILSDDPTVRDMHREE